MSKLEKGYSQDLVKETVVCAYLPHRDVIHGDFIMILYTHIYSTYFSQAGQLSTGFNTIHYRDFTEYICE